MFPPRGIGLTADRLSITRPALTRVIARLERQLGARLFERSPTGVRLTTLGAALVEPAQRVLREIETAQGRADDARSGRAGRFRVPPFGIARCYGCSAVGKRAIPTLFQINRGTLEGALRISTGHCDEAAFCISRASLASTPFSCST